MDKEKEIKKAPEKKKRRFPLWARIIAVILAVLAVVGVGIGTGAFVFLEAQLSKITKYDPDSVETVDPSDESFETDAYVDGTEIIEPGDIEWGDDVNSISTEGVTNILLIGQDTRSEGTTGRSDSMMILTIDKNEKKLKITSLMRDMYVQIPGYSDNRINAAYAFGGYDLLKATIEKNFGITIDYFAEVDFFAFQKIVDILGGIYVDLNEEEAKLLKGLGHRTKEGRNRLDGAAALAYCTTRYVGNSDYERTERQRKAFSSIYARLKETVTLPMLMDLINEILPLITTNMTNGEIMSHAVSAFNMDVANIEQYRLPVDGTFTPAYINGMAVLVPDLQKNREYLKEIIYGNENSEE